MTLYGVLKLRWVVVIGFLASVLVGGLTVFAVQLVTEPITKTVTMQAPESKPVAPKDYDEFVAAYGKPTQDVPGEQINPNLKGAVCSILYVEGKKTVSQVTACHAPTEQVVG